MSATSDSSSPRTFLRALLWRLLLAKAAADKGPTGAARIGVTTPSELGSASAGCSSVSFALAYRLRWAPAEELRMSASSELLSFWISFKCARSSSSSSSFASISSSVALRRALGSGRWLLLSSMAIVLILRLRDGSSRPPLSPVAAAWLLLRGDLMRSYWKTLAFRKQLPQPQTPPQNQPRATP